MSCGGGSGGGQQNPCQVQLMTDPCYQKLCCNQRKPVCYKQFVPSYERCNEEVKMGKLLGFDYQRRWFCERNIWMCKTYGQCGELITGQGPTSLLAPVYGGGACSPPQPQSCPSRGNVSPCCPAPRITLCQPDPCGPCCKPMPPCPPRCPPNPVFPKVCCPPPCIPDPCIKPSRKCFLPPPCCPKPCCKKLALVISPPICPPKCCPPQACCDPPADCPDPCARKASCCGSACPAPAMIVRPVRNSCCPPPPRIQNKRSEECPIPCANPLPPCCVIVKPCKPCPPTSCCAPPQVCCQPTCPQPDPRCCPKPMVVSFKMPTAVRPVARRNECPDSVRWPSAPKIDSCCSSGCPPKQNDFCYMTVQPPPPSYGAPRGGRCGGVSGGGTCC